MRKSGYRLEVIDYRKSLRISYSESLSIIYYFLFPRFISCAQAVQTSPATHSITTKITHSLHTKINTHVYKSLVYTLARVQLLPDCLRTLSQLFRAFLQRYPKSYTHYTQGLLLPTTELI